jgi:hypothetical protein
MKTLIYTAIYNNLYGTEYGGRPSREIHYKYSLLNILNLKADKFICFTQKSDLENLKNWFYVENKISEELLEFKISELNDFLFNEYLDKNKNYDQIKTIDRCYEIQYNKFIWFDTTYLNILNFDKVYWFDAGLSHSGLFPEKFTQSTTYYKYFNFSLFNENYLKYLNGLTDNNKLVILGKNNTHDLYWSNSIPEKYYNNYNKDIHIIGGLFGGNTLEMSYYTQNMRIIILKLLLDETDLYYEELIMSCYYQNNQDKFNLLNFDDWYNRELPTYTTNTKFFYNLFEI